MSQSNSSLESLLHALQHHSAQPIVMGLERVQALCERLGNPHMRLPPVIHIAGTNGKGSLSAYLHALANEAGLRAHRYNSPHLVHFNERMTVADHTISDQQLLECLRAVQGPAQDLQASFFESTTAAAYLAFAQTPADLLILETGMGGRLDATNIVTPILTAITPISMDHQAFLGNTLEAIASEKAGIIKSGVPCVLGPQPAAAAQVIARQARLMNSRLYAYGHDWRIEPQDGGFTYVSNDHWLDGVVPSLAGEHQCINAATAMACFEMLSSMGSFTDAQMRRGIARANWPARLQCLKDGPWAALLPEGELWLDGGHNEGAAIVLHQWMQSRARPIHVICGMLADKDHAAFLAMVGERAASVQCLQIPEAEHAASADALVSAAEKSGIVAEKAESLEKAMLALCKRHGSTYDVLICGSLYLAGYVLGRAPQ